MSSDPSLDSSKEALGLPGVPPESSLPNWVVPSSVQREFTHPSSDPAPWELPNYDPRTQANLYSSALTDRPLLVWVYSIIAWFGGGTLLLGSFLLFFLAATPALLSNTAFQEALNASNSTISSTDIFMIGGVFSILVAAINLIVGWYFFKGSRWAWWTFVIIAGFALAGSLLSLNITSIVGQTLSLLILLWPSTRQWCKTGF